MKINAIGTNSIQSNNFGSGKNTGDDVISQISSGKNVTAQEIISASRGTFGISQEKLTPILEYLTNELKNAREQQKIQEQVQKQTENKLKQAMEELQQVPQRIKFVTSAAQSSTEAEYKRIISEKQSEIDLLKATIKSYKTTTVDNSVAVTPQEAIGLIDDMIANQDKAIRSMEKYLFSGEGAEEAIEQIKRNNRLAQIYQDGVHEIPKVKAKLDELKENGISPDLGWRFTLNLMSQTIKGYGDSEYFLATPVYKTAKHNAEALISPMTDEKYSNTNYLHVFSTLDRKFSEMRAFHKMLPSAIEKQCELLEKQGYSNIVHIKVQGHPEKSGIKYSNEGHEEFISYNRIVVQM